MKKKLQTFSLVVIALLLIGIIIFEKGGNRKEEICSGVNCFSLEVVDTEEKRALGLMFRESLAEDSGMFFVFDSPGKHTFWMKDTFIPLDIIWLDEELQIVSIKENATPCFSDRECEIFKPDKEAKYVLEINAGKARELGLEEGDMLKWKKDMQ